MKTVRWVLFAALLLSGTFPFISCDPPPSPNTITNQVTIALENNATSPTETSALYLNQDSQSLAMSQCAGTPTTGDGEICTTLSTSPYENFLIGTPLEGVDLPDLTILTDFDPGFYWVTFLFQQNDPVSGCLISSASGVFEIAAEENVDLTLTVGVPHSCEDSTPTPSPCAITETQCDDVCVNVNTDSSNCGACGNECGVGEECSAGACESVCSPSETFCDGFCVDTDTDDDNCGECGLVCAGGESCIAGVCTL